jgi:hypothetical protein
MATPNGNHSIKRIQLPSGKTIEVVFFESADAQPIEAEPTAVETPRLLHMCPSCDSELVYPMEWEEAGRHAWSVTLRCPSCERIETGVFPQAVVDTFDEELDRGTEALIDDLEQLTRANMGEEIDRFTAALEADAILPMDF